MCAFTDDLPRGVLQQPEMKESDSSILGSRKKPVRRRSMIERVYRNATIMFALMIMLMPALLAPDELPNWKTIETSTHRFREIAPGGLFCHRHG
jgi:hypothetical protein